MTKNSSRVGTRPAGVSGERETAEYVQRMFSGIAPRYDLLNRALSFGLDQRWRRRAARLLAARLAAPDARALDLCCGTGDLALALAREGGAAVVGADFSHPMLIRARQKAEGRATRVSLVEADALRLPSTDNQFDLVTAAFGFRNLADYHGGLAEILRVLKPGGQVGLLEFTLPTWQPFAGVYGFYFRQVLPLIGRAVSGVKGPYSYLPASVERFPEVDELARWMESAGFVDVSYERWTGGTVALHRGTKPLR